METMINEIVEKFKKEIEEFFHQEAVEIDRAEAFFTPRVSQVVTDLLAAYYEKVDEALLADKAGRKVSGLVVQRRSDSRQILTRLGTVEYRRTYYKQAMGGYCYPVDALAGVEAYERVSGGVSLDLVETALAMSYAKSSQTVTGGKISRQTVMNKIRQSSVPASRTVERRKVPVLHVDADEDHVHLQTGQNTIVPLISIYEGIEKRGKRGSCKNVFQISEYGKKPDDLWEEVLNELERRYDLEDTKIYLHGDGAAWIRHGLDWLPNSVFVLDRYHKNKAVKQAVSGIERKYGCQYEALLRKALREGDRDLACSIQESLLLRWPEHAETIHKGTDYLLNHFDSIHTFETDPEAANGGATEPHISNILSARLSSRPMAWSRVTLEKFVPLLAARCCTSDVQPAQVSEQVKRVRQKVIGRRHPVKHSLGLPDPERAVSLPGLSGKVTPLFIALRHFNH